MAVRAVANLAEITSAPKVCSDPRALKAHTERIIHLTRETSAVAHHASARERWVDVFALGVALSWSVDLRIIGDGESNWRNIWPHAFPTGRRSDFGDCRFREAIHLDTPRYEAAWSRGAGCPGSGPRGGKCREKPTPLRKWVTNLNTGDWEHREICATHQALAFERHRDSPDPQPNRGGVLAAVFPEYDMDATYRYVTPEYVAGAVPASPRVVARPKLSLVVGGDL
jgi:hypothetical protein